MQSDRVVVAVVTLIILTGGIYHQTSAEVDLTAGIGYDFLSQEYFLDSIVDVGQDSVLSNWSLQTDYFNDLKSTFSARYRPGNSRHTELRGDLELTDEFLRLTSLTDLRARLGSAAIDIDTEAELKARYRGQAQFGDDYWRLYARSRLSQPLADGLNGRVQLMAERVDFDSNTTTSYDFFRVGGRLGIERLFSSFSYFSADLFWSLREVDNNSELNYNSIGSELSLIGIYGGGELDAFGRFEIKDYDLPFDDQDYYLTDLDLRNRIDLGQAWFSRLEADLEWLHYTAEDPLLSSYYRAKMAALLAWTDDILTVGAGPHFQLLKEQSESTTDNEDYLEAGAQVEVEYFRLGSVFLTAENLIGWRDHQFEAEFYSDFLFNRASLIADARLSSQLRLSVFFSSEWEWHREELDDSRLVLLSTSLNYSF